MPAGFQHIPVPLFRKYEVILAELCALDLWQGIDYVTGKQMTYSDEEFLQMFSTPVEAIYRNPRTRQNITEPDVRSLVISARLKALFRSTLPTDFQAGIAALKTVVMPVYRGWRDKSLKLTSTGYATRAILDWSTTFVNNTSGVSLNGNHRVPLACRILFYATPDMKVFNFSNGLTKAMRFQCRPQAALGEFSLAAASLSASKSSKYFKNSIQLVCSM